MTIDLRRYIRNGRRGGKNTPATSAVQINLRFRREGLRPTRNEMIDALKYTIDERAVPPGWQFTYIEWSSPSKARGHRSSARWVEGSLADATDSNLAYVIGAVYDNPTRMGIVRDNGAIDPLEDVQAEYWTVKGTPTTRGRAEHLADLARLRVDKWESEIVTLSRKLAGYKSARHIADTQRKLSRAFGYFDRATAELEYYGQQFAGEFKMWTVEVGIDYGM